MVAAMLPRAALLGLVLLAACGSTPDEAPGIDAPAVDACAALAIEACRDTAGCVVDVCFDCTCAPSFVGCRAADAVAHDCPDLGCAQPECCRAEGECSQGAMCAIEQPDGCGACMPGPGDCDADSECGADEICAPIRCSCSGARRCTAGCETDACDLGQVCNADTDRCEEQPCGPDRDGCPSNFVCTWPEGGCMRLDCTSDENCPTGFCALGFCHESIGTCYLPPP